MVEMAGQQPGAAPQAGGGDKGNASQQIGQLMSALLNMFTKLSEALKQAGAPEEVAAMAADIVQRIQAMAKALSTGGQPQAGADSAGQSTPEQGGADTRPAM